MFDENFLKERLRKQANWRKKGVRAGHGGDFSDSFGLSSNEYVFPGSEYDTSLVHSPDLLARDGSPSWLVKIINNDLDIQQALTHKGYKIQSPHKIALVALAKKPELLKGQEEHYLQVRLFYTVEIHYPELYQAMKAVPNGGLRSKTTAGKMKAEGQKAGTPDIDIDYPRGIYHGMKLEVKTDKGHLQHNQIDSLAYYNGNGYYAVCGKGFDDCFNQLMAYWSLPEFDNKTRLSNQEHQ